MKRFLLVMFMICCFSCRTKTHESSAVDKGISTLTYRIKYAELKRKLLSTAEPDPFDELGNLFPIQLFERAGIKNFDNVHMVYLYGHEELIITAPYSFHCEVKNHLQVTGKPREIQEQNGKVNSIAPDFNGSPFGTPP